MNHARFKYIGLALTFAAVATLTACAQTAVRNEPTATIPAPEPTATSVPEVSTPVPTAVPTVAPTATESPSPTPIPVPTATASPQPEPSPTTIPTPVGSPTAIPVSNTQTYTLSLEIEGLSDESIVRGDSIVARGQTSVGAIVSINGVIVPVDETGHFEVALMLDPGPNAIEVVASDLDGNQVSTVLAVVSLPEETA